MMANRLLAVVATFSGVAAKTILIAGDSWGTFGSKSFNAVMQKHSPETTITNIAIGGTTAGVWKNWPEFGNLKNHAKDADYLWFTIGGNDALAFLPECASKNKTKSAAECVNEFKIDLMDKIDVIMQGVHEANPKIKVVGFGYDVLGMDKEPLCPTTGREVFPQCTKPPEGGSGADYISCWNTQFIRIQEGWEEFSKKYDFVNTVSLLGSLQASENDPKAVIGKPDLAKWSPQDLMQWNCIHPTDKGFEIVFENLWNLYWSKELGGNVVV